MVNMDLYFDKEKLQQKVYLNLQSNDEVVLQTIVEKGYRPYKSMALRVLEYFELPHSYLDGTQFRDVQDMLSELASEYLELPVQFDYDDNGNFCLILDED